MLNAVFGGHSNYMDFRVRVLDTSDPLMEGVTDMAVTDELYFPIVPNPSLSKVCTRTWSM